MIRPGGPGLAVYVCLDPVDFRKQIAGLASVVQYELEFDPFAAAVFVFTNRRRTAVKMLLWERNGYVLWHKKLERERFHWPRASARQRTVSLSVQELNWLLDGIDLRYFKPHQVLHYDYAG